MNFTPNKPLAYTVIMSWLVDALKLNKKYISTIAIYRQDGTILKVLFEETLNIRRDLVCSVDGDNLIVYYKDDNSVVKKESISSILLTQN